MQYAIVFGCGVVSCAVGVALVFTDAAPLVGFFVLIAGLLCIVGGFGLSLLRPPSKAELAREDDSNPATWHFSRGGIPILIVVIGVWLLVAQTLARAFPDLAQGVIDAGRWRNLSYADLIALGVTVPPALWLFRKVPFHTRHRSHED